MECLLLQTLFPVLVSFVEMFQLRSVGPDVVLPTANLFQAVCLMALECSA